MAFDITDFNRTEIYITEGWREWYLPKFRIYMVVDEPYITIYWTDTEQGASGVTRQLTMDYQDVTFGYISPSSASEIELEMDLYIDSAWTDIVPGGVVGITAAANQPVIVNNTDPTNPIIDFQWLVQTQTTDFTLALSDAWSDNVCDTASSIEITVPTNASVAFPIDTEIMFGDVDSGLTFFTPAGGVTINSRNGWTGIDGPGGVVRLTKVDTNEWFLDGDLKLALDVDAEALITAMEGAGGSFTVSEKGYINDWFLGMKADGVYATKQVVYLALGGSAATVKFNAVNPVDSDAAFRGTPVGSPTVSANGVSNNGTTQYTRTHYTPSTHGSQDSKCYCIYLRTVGGGSQFGATNAAVAGDLLHIDVGGSMYWAVSRTFNTDSPPATKTRFWTVNRDTSTSADLRRNDVSEDTSASASSVNVAQEIVISARNSNGTVNVFSADQWCYFSIGSELTSAQITAEYNHTQQLQVDFGRNV